MAVNRSLLFVLILFAAIGATSQERITIAFENETLGDALVKLDQRTEQQLSYNPQTLPLDNQVSASFTDRAPEDILSEVLGSSYQLKNIGNYIIIQKVVIAKKEKASFEIKGGIRDAKTGEELKDVSIYEVNTLRSTLSDDGGAFKLKANSEYEEATFVISKKFYRDTIIRLSNKVDLGAPIVLKPQEEASKGLQIRERVKVFSSGIAKFFTSIELRRNAQNVNYTDTRWFQASLVPSVGTNRKMSSQIKNRISLNLIAGYSYGVRGAEVGGVYNIAREEVRGVQIGGFGNTVGGEVHGFQAGGFINTSKDFVNGAQLAGFFNLASDSVNGFQAAGFTNITRDMGGFQVAGFNNHTKKVSGVQTAGFINTTGELDGLQLAGFLNIAREVKGLQFSIINIADTVSSGLPFGLVSIVKKNGFVSPAIESDDVIPYRLAIRTGMDKFYTVLSGGIRPDEYWSFGVGFGSRLFFSEKKALYFNPETRWINLADGQLSESNSMLVRANLNLGYQLFKRLSITTGPAANLYIANNLDESNNPVIEIASSPIIDGLSGNTRLQFWVGYSFGIGF